MARFARRGGDIHEVSISAAPVLGAPTNNDGFVEVFNNRDEMLGVKGFQDIVHRSASRSLPDMKQAILEEVAAWRNGALNDDMSLVIVELR